MAGWLCGESVLSLCVCVNHDGWLCSASADVVTCVWGFLGSCASCVPRWLAGCIGFVWVHADSFLHCVASPFHSFVTTL